MPATPLDRSAFDVLAQRPATLRALLSPVPRDVVEAPADEGWSPKDMVAHLLANHPWAMVDPNGVAAAASGEIDVGFVNHYYVHRFLQESGEGFGARNHYLTDGGPGGIVLVAGSGILQTADNRENAGKFLRFMLSTVAQQYFASQTFEYPSPQSAGSRSAMS